VPPPPPPAVSSAKLDTELLRTLAVLATRRAPTASELAETARAIETKQITLDTYIDSLLATPEFARDVAPVAILRQFLTLEGDGIPVGKPLSRVPGATPLYYLTEKPCAVKDAVKVHPWWDLSTEVLVCADAYRPEKWSTEAVAEIGLPGSSCYSIVGGTGPRCGCGPNLIRCYESEDHQQRVVDSLRAELRDTVAWVVSHDLPAETIFTSNSTFRDRNAEAQQRIEAVQFRQPTSAAANLEDLAAWPAEGKWAPRENLAPGQHAGLLTAPMLLQGQPDRRQRMAAIYDVMWCTQQNSAGAAPEAMMTIKNGSLQIDSAGWKELAQRPICTGCHARLDYGMQFFWGYQNGYLQAYFAPPLQQKGRGEFFVDSHDDQRGTADLNPHAFSELAVAQPEFRKCMAQDLGGYVMGNKLSQATLEKLTSVAKPNGTSIRAIMRASLHALVDEWSTADVAPGALASGSPAADHVALTPALTAQLQTHCLDCHDADPDRIDLSQPQLSRSTVAKMLADVGFGRMPDGHPLPDPERTQFIDAFVAATWSGADAKVARDYYLNGMQALPAYRPEVVFELIRRITGSEPPPVRAYERFIRWDQQQVTPSLAATTGVAAIESCRTTNKDRPAEVARCIETAIRLDVMAIDGRPKP
jgi:hypothetical protein